jgi:hypothetical protein
MKAAMDMAWSKGRDNGGLCWVRKMNIHIGDPVAETDANLEDMARAPRQPQNLEALTYPYPTSGLRAPSHGPPWFVFLGILKDRLFGCALVR